MVESKSGRETNETNWRSVDLGMRDWLRSNSSVSTFDFRKEPVFLAHAGKTVVPELFLARPKPPASFARSTKTQRIWPTVSDCRSVATTVSPDRSFCCYQMKANRLLVTSAFGSASLRLRRNQIPIPQLSFRAPAQTHPTSLLRGVSRFVTKSQRNAARLSCMLNQEICPTVSSLAS